MRVIQIRTQEEFYALRSEWNELVEKSDSKNIFLTWEWLYTWWEVYSPKKQLHILLFKENNDQIKGIAPFYISYESTFGMPMRILKLIGSEVVCSEYLDIIAQKGKEDEIIKMLVSYLLSEFTDWDILYFKDIAENSIIQKVSVSLKHASNITYEDRIQTTNPFLSLPENEKIFISSLSHNRRSAIKKKEKKLAREHGFSFHVVNGESGLDEAFTNFVSLHQKLWKSRGLPGMFKRKHFLKFHENVAKRFAEKEWIQLYFLSSNRKCVASLYGFKYDKKFYLYQSGTDPDWKVYGVGIILLNHTILEAIRSKLVECDFLRGGGDYKFNFTNTFRHTMEITLAKNTYRTSTYVWKKNMIKRLKEFIKGVLPLAIVNRIKKIRDWIVLR